MPLCDQQLDGAGRGCQLCNMLAGRLHTRPPQSSVQQSHAAASKQLSAGMASASAMLVSAPGGTVSSSVVAPVWGGRRVMLRARRAAGTPRWNNPAGGNHDWVEFWDAGAWSFLGAAEPAPPNVTWWAVPWHASSPLPACHATLCQLSTWQSECSAGLHAALRMSRVLNLQASRPTTSELVCARPRFFPEPARRALEGDAQSAIYAASWAPTPGGTLFPLAWNAAYRYVHAYDVSASYASKAAFLDGR